MFMAVCMPRHSDAIDSFLRSNVGLGRHANPQSYANRKDYYTNQFQ
jgi:hypothetical protein